MLNFNEKMNILERLENFEWNESTLLWNNKKVLVVNDREMSMWNFEYGYELEFNEWIRAIKAESLGKITFEYFNPLEENNITFYFYELKNFSDLDLYYA